MLPDAITSTPTELFRSGCLAMLAAPRSIFRGSE
jgi:hypothetical protein